LSRFAGRALALNEEVYTSAFATNHRNRGMAWLLQSYHRIYGDPTAVVDLYTRQSCLSVSARDLAVMGRRLPTAGSTR
jgi:glutaminase